VATYGSHPWVFRDLPSQQLMGVQFQASRVTSFEAYRFVYEKQQLGLLTGDKVQQVVAGRVVLSVVIVPPFYTLHTLKQRSLHTIASILLQTGQGGDSDHSDSVQNRLVSLGLPATLQHRLMVMLRQQ
jgi:hypothetical protein